MNKKELKSILTGAMLSAPLTVFAHQEGEHNNHEELFPSQPNASLIISHEEECAKVSSLAEQCFQVQRLDFSAHNQWLHNTIKVRNTGNDKLVFTDNDELREFTFGVHSQSASLDLGLYDLEHPIHKFFDQDRMSAPISLDKSLRKQSIEAQIGLRAFKRFDLSDNWSVSTSLSASKTRDSIFSNADRPKEIYGQQNQFRLLSANDVRRNDADRLIESFESQTRAAITDVFETISQDENLQAAQSLQEFLQGLATDGTTAEDIQNNTIRFLTSPEGQQLTNQIETLAGQIKGLPDIQGAIENSPLSQTAKDFTTLASWLYLNSEGKRNDIVNSVDYGRIANEVNNFTLTDNIQSGDILPYLEEHLSPEDAALFETTFQEQLVLLQNELDENTTVTPAQLKALAKDAVEKFYADLDQKIKSDPERYHTLLDQNVQHATDLHDAYQDKTTYYANTEIRYQGENHDWRFGLHGHKRQSDFLATEERYGLYSISSWDINEKTNLTSVLSLDYYKNRYGFKESEDKDNEDGNVLVYERLKYAVNDNISVYGAIGGTATLLDGAFLTTEFGAQACTQALGGNLCAHGAYEKNKSLDGYEHRYFDVESLEGSGTKLGVTYEYDF